MDTKRRVESFTTFHRGGKLLFSSKKRQQYLKKMPLLLVYRKIILILQEIALSQQCGSVVRTHSVMNQLKGSLPPLEKQKKNSAVNLFILRMYVILLFSLVVSDQSSTRVKIIVCLNDYVQYNPLHKVPNSDYTLTPLSKPGDYIAKTAQ